MPNQEFIIRNDKHKQYKKQTNIRIVEGQKVAKNPRHTAQSESLQKA